MRILFKTSYLDDIRLFQHEGQVLWYSLLGLAVLAAPWLLPVFYVGELTQIFILAIAGVGLMLLIGYTGLVSLGHGAFMAIGAYTNTYLITKGVPFLVAFPLAGLAALIAGIVIAVPANRMSGIYLAIATLAFSQIVEQVIVRWEHVTRGFQGMAVPPPDLLGQPLTQGWQLYYLALAVLVLVVLGAINLVRSPTGRALVAIRDFGDLGAEPRRQPVPLQDGDLRAERLHHRAGRRAAGAPHALHLAGRLQLPDVDPAPADGGGGRPRLHPRRHPGRDLRRRAAAGHRADARVPADGRSPARRAWSRACSASSWC